MGKIGVFVTLLMLLSGVVAAQAQFRGVVTAVKNVPKSVIVAKACESALRQQQILQQHNRLTASHVQSLNDIQRVQRLDRQATMRRQLLQSTIQPVSFAPQAEQKNNEVSRVPAKEGDIGK